MTSMYTGVSGLMVNQASLNTTAHNIANATTLGFTRQQILTGDFIYNKIGESATSYMKVGLGTEMAAIRQVRDVFLDKSYRLEVGREGFYEAQYESVEEIESLFGELEGEAFKTTLSDLWTSISELAKEPDSIVNRGVLVTTAKSFLEKAGIISDQLQEYQVNLNEQIQKKTDRINTIGNQIQELNQTIRKYECGGQHANDYRDIRNQLMDELGGLVKYTYTETQEGVVMINVEGVQFVTEDTVYQMETQKTVTPEEQGRTDTINGYVKNISDLMNQMKANGKTDAEIEKAVKESKDWSSISKYGKMTYQAGEIKYNDYGVIQKDGTVNEILPKQSDLLTVLWKGNGCGEVFRLDGEYSASAKTDTGSLKGLLVSRGAYEANYTNIPKESDYPNEKDYKEAVKEYNKYVDPSIIMSTQTQFDQLIHGVVKAINDLLCPNTPVSPEKISEYLEKTTENKVDPGKVDLKNATITLADGTVVKAEDAQIFDTIKAGCGMDKEGTQGEALFERKTVERYTKGTLKVNVDGKDTNIDVWVYNPEYPSDNYSLFTIGQVEINEEILNDYNKIPLSYNKYSGKYGSFNQELCGDLIDVWDVEALKINPNTLTTNNFQDYYSSMTTEIAYRGKTYSSIAKNQSDMVKNIDNNRQQVAGVSTDEELTNMIKYQHAYNASSRYINAINEMLGHVIEKLG